MNKSYIDQRLETLNKELVEHQERYRKLSLDAEKAQDDVHFVMKLIAEIEEIKKHVPIARKGE